MTRKMRLRSYDRYWELKRCAARSMRVWVQRAQRAHDAGMRHTHIVGEHTNHLYHAMERRLRILERAPI